jgi:hypothetical protein
VLLKNNEIIDKQFEMGITFFYYILYGAEFLASRYSDFSHFIHIGGTSHSLNNVLVNHKFEGGGSVVIFKLLYIAYFATPKTFSGVRPAPELHFGY